MTPAAPRSSTRPIRIRAGRLDPHDGRYAVGGGHGHEGTDLFLAPGAVLEVDQQPVEAGGRAHLGRSRPRRAPTNVPSVASPRGHAGGAGDPRRAVRGVRGHGHPYHLWSARPISYSARSPAVVGSLLTSAGATSHQTSEPGRSACGYHGDHDDHGTAVVTARRQRLPDLGGRNRPGRPWPPGRPRLGPGRAGGTPRQGGAVFVREPSGDGQRGGAVAELVAELGPVAAHLQTMDHLEPLVLGHHDGDRQPPPGPPSPARSGP